MILIGSILVLSALVTVNDLKRLDFTLYETPRYPALISGFALVVVGLIGHFFRDQAKPQKQVRGKWYYEVSGASGLFTHSGECEITQNGTFVKLHGTRRAIGINSDGKQTLKRVTIPWSSVYGNVCHDDFLRFEYTIDLPETGTLRAICRLNINHKKPKQMNGDYYMLPPIPEGTLNTRSGHVLFRKLNKNEDPFQPEPQISLNESSESENRKTSSPS
ncbi:MAG: hypothetical protein AAF710_11105 [Planctomycetota bacterium]